MIVRKRYRRPKIKPGQLLMWYGTTGDGEPPDICFGWGGDGANKRDGGLLHWYISGQKLTHVYGAEAIEEGRDTKWLPSLIEELTIRGYDITTLKFSIERKKPDGNTN